jgi:hypothetical protein
MQADVRSQRCIAQTPVSAIPFRGERAHEHGPGDANPFHVESDSCTEFIGK